MRDTPTRSPARRSLRSATRTAGCAGAVGLVPDGVEAVDLDLIDGTTRRLPVGRNVWAVGAEPVVSARFDGTTVRIP